MLINWGEICTKLVQECFNIINNDKDSTLELTYDSVSLNLKSSTLDAQHDSGWFIFF